ncbi:MAG: hypothetical protein WAT09_02095 [Paracoccaceae bacterium]
MHLSFNQHFQSKPPRGDLFNNQGIILESPPHGLFYSSGLHGIVLDLHVGFDTMGQAFRRCDLPTRFFSEAVEDYGETCAKIGKEPLLHSITRAVATRPSAR